MELINSQDFANHFFTIKLSNIELSSIGLGYQKKDEDGDYEWIYIPKAVKISEQLKILSKIAKSIELNADNLW